MKRWQSFVVYFVDDREQSRLPLKKHWTRTGAIAFAQSMAERASVRQAVKEARRDGVDMEVVPEVFDLKHGERVNAER